VLPTKVDFSKLPFSQRESEILLLAAEGLTDKEIAIKISIAEGTIRTYWERIRKKVESRSRGEAIAKALRLAYDAALAQLSEAQEWMGMMIDCAKDLAIFRTDAAGKILTWNPGVFHVLGYTEEEFLGMNIGSLFTEADRALKMPESERDVARETGRSFDDRWHVRKDKVLIWVEGVLVMLRDGDRELGFAKIMQDRSEEYQAKREVERLVQLSPSGDTIESNPNPNFTSKTVSS